MTVPLRAASPRARSRSDVAASARREREARAERARRRRRPPRLRPVLAELTPDHFYDPLHRALRDHLVDGAPLDEAGIGLLAELDAYAEAEGIGEAPAPNCCSGCASGSCSASFVRRRSTAAANSPRRLPDCASGQPRSAHRARLHFRRRTIPGSSIGRAFGC